MKYGDPRVEILFLESDAGVLQAFASYAAFIAAGWTLTWIDTAGVALSTQPTYTIADDGTGRGRHNVLFTIPSVDSVILVNWPAGFRADPITIDLFMAAADADSVTSLITSSVGTPVNQNRQSIYDFDHTEGDSFRREVTIPLAALTDYGYSDLSDIAAVAWTVACQARKPENRLAASVDFTITATISDKTNRKVLLSFVAGLTGTTIPADANKNSQAFYYDVQLVTPVGAPSPAPAKISGVRGTITVKRQETTTP